MSPVIQNLNGLFRKLPTWVLYVLLTLPAFWTFYAAATGLYGFDPVRALEHQLGLITFQLLIAILMVSPLLQILRLNLMKFRRCLGVMTFVYASLHFATYLFLDAQLAWAEILADMTKRPYIIVGTLALLLMLPLAATSNNWSLRKLGAARWRQLHYLIYPLSILAVLHFLWLVKSFKSLPLEPFVYSGLIAVLLSYRAIRHLWRARSALRPA